MNIFSSGKSDRKQRRAGQFQGPTSGGPSKIPTEPKQNNRVKRRNILKWLGFGTAATAGGMGYWISQYLRKHEAPSPSTETTRESMISEDRAILEEITRQLREATDRYYAEMRRLAHLNQSFNQLKPLADIVGQAIVNIFTSHQNDTQMPEIGEAMAKWRQEGKLTHMDLLDMVAVLERYFARHHQVLVLGPVETDIDGYFIPGFYQLMLAERVTVPGGEWTHSPVPGNAIDAEEVAVGRESISFQMPLAAFSIRKAWGRTRPLIVYRIPSFEKDVENLRQLTRRYPTRLSVSDAIDLIRAERYEELTDHIISDLVHADFNRLPTENAEEFRALVLPAIRRVTGLHEWGHLAESEGANAQTSNEAMREAIDHEVLAYWQELGYSGFPCLSIQSLFGAASIESGQTLQARSQNPHFVAAGEYFNLLADVIHSDRQTFSMVSVNVPPDIANDPQKVMFFYLAQLALIPRDIWIALGKHPIARGPMGSNVKPPGARGESGGPKFYSRWAAGIGVIKPSQPSPAAPASAEPLHFIPVLGKLVLRLTRWLKWPDEAAVIIMGLLESLIFGPLLVNWHNDNLQTFLLQYGWSVSLPVLLLVRSLVSLLLFMWAHPDRLYWWYRLLGEPKRAPDGELLWIPVHRQLRVRPMRPEDREALRWWALAYRTLYVSNVLAFPGAWWSGLIVESYLHIVRNLITRGTLAMMTVEIFLKCHTCVF